MTQGQYDKNLIDGAKSQSQIGVDLKRRPGWILRCISWCMLEWSKSKKGENSLVGTEIEMWRYNDVSVSKTRNLDEQTAYILFYRKEKGPG